MTADKMNELIKLRDAAKVATDALKKLGEIGTGDKERAVYSLLRECSGPLRSSDFEFVRHWLSVLIKNRSEQAIKRFEEAA